MLCWACAVDCFVSRRAHAVFVGVGLSESPVGLACFFVCLSGGSSMAMVMPFSTPLCILFYTSD